MTEALHGRPDTTLAEGSAYYYVARFCAPQRRAEVAAWLTWFDHIDRIGLQMRDPGVSRLKLDWWREEAALARQGEGRHPLSRALADVLAADWQVREMETTVTAVEHQILQHQPATPGEFREMGRQHWGSRFRLLSGSGNQDQRRIADAAGYYYASVLALQHLARQVSAGYLPLPHSAVQEHGLASAELQSERHSRALEQLSGELLSDAQAAWQALKPEARRSPGFDPVLRLTAQGDRIARLLSRRRFQTHRSTPLATPIGLLWSAWRAR